MNDEYFVPPQYFNEKESYLPFRIYQKKLYFSSCHIYHLETTDFNRWVKTTSILIYLFLEHHIPLCVCFEKRIDVFCGLL
jgi:hypothetical protein